MKYFSWIISSLVLMVACDIKQDDVQPTDELVKIYNHPNQELLYYAESFVQLNDGFLILAGSKVEGQELRYPTATLIRTNKLGEVQWTKETTWQAPAGLVELTGNYGFVAMNSNRLAQFITIDVTNGELTDSTSLNITVPLSIKKTSDDKLIVLGFDFGGWNSTVTTFTSDLQQINSVNLPVGDEEYVIEIEEHITKVGYEYPFFIGEWEAEGENGFFVNCFYNYTFGVLFFDASGLRTGGWIIVHQVKYAASSLLHKDENEYAFTWYNNNQNYISPGIEVDISNLQDFNDTEATTLYELPLEAKIVASKVSFDGSEYMLFASGTNSNAVNIMQYTLDDNNLYNTETVDFPNRVEVVDLLQDQSDEGIVILARIYLSGKYPRPLMHKIPKSHFRTN